MQNQRHLFFAIFTIMSYIRIHIINLTNEQKRTNEIQLKINNKQKHRRQCVIWYVCKAHALAHNNVCVCDDTIATCVVNGFDKNVATTDTDDVCCMVSFTHPSTNIYIYISNLFAFQKRI